MIRILFCALVVILSAVCPLWAQDIQSITGRIDEQRYEYPQEKIHVMTDRGCYLAGDTIWLRAWVVDASSHRQVDVSQFVYVELVAPDDSVCARVKIHQDSQGLFKGYLPLDLELPEGRYQLTAYTMFMQNAGADYFYRQPIDVTALCSMRKRITSKCVRYSNEIDVTLRYENADGQLSAYNNFGYASSDLSWNEMKYHNRIKEMHLTLKGKDADMSSLLVGFDNYYKYITLPEREIVDMSFYPEGGYLVPGVENTVTFKMHNDASMTLAAAGELVDGDGQVIAPLTVEHDGMGLLRFTPVAGSAYTARWKNDLDETLTFELPQARPDATVLQVRRDADGLIKVNAVGVKASQSLILIQQRGQVLAAGTGEVDLNEGALPPGVVQALLLDQNMRCLSERLFFACSDTLTAEPAVKADKAFYSDREPVKISVDLSGITREGGNYAVTVIDAAASSQSQGNICANLLLQSELKGHINQPAYYFETDDSTGMAQRRRHLDLLMLTQGWRRYDIPRVLRGHLVQPEHPIEVSQVVTGRVLSDWRKEPVANAKVSMIAPRVEYSALTVSDSLGQFAFNLPLLPDSVDCIVMAENTKGKKQMNLELDAEHFPQVYYLTDNHQARESQVILEEQGWRMERNGDWRHIMLNELLVTAVRPRRAPDERSPYFLTPRKIASKGIHSIDAVVHEFPGIMIADGNICTTSDRMDHINIVIDGELVTSEISGAPDGIDKYVKTENLSRDEQMMFLSTSATSSGFNASEVNMAQTLVNFDELAAVKLIRERRGGYLLFYHKEGHVRGAGRSNPPSLYLKVIQPVGIQQAAEYYNPRYDQGDCGMAPGTDVRTLLYWNPCVMVGGDGASTFDFYASDVHNTTYLLTIEGVMPDGSLVHTTRQLTKR